MVLRSLLSTGSRYPVREPFEALQQAMPRLFSEAWRGMPEIPLTEAAAMAVRMDVKEDDKAFHVTVDLPGLTEKEVDVTFDDGILTIRGERKVERDEKGDMWHVVERSQGSFVRQLSLPTNVDAEKIEASLQKGVLVVTLPKQDSAQATVRKIGIKGG